MAAAREGLAGRGLIHPLRRAFGGQPRAVLADRPDGGLGVIPTFMATSETTRSMPQIPPAARCFLRWSPGTTSSGCYGGSTLSESLPPGPGVDEPVVKVKLLKVSDRHPELLKEVVTAWRPRVGHTSYPSLAVSTKGIQ